MVEQSIRICQHEGFNIDLRLPEGMFAAKVEESFVTSYSLKDLRERLTKMHNKSRVQSRKAMQPVSVWVIHIDSMMPQLLSILGVVAGRSHTPTLRTSVGHVDADSIRFLADGDSRIVQTCLFAERQNTARVLYHEAVKAYKSWYNDLPKIIVPLCASREDAFDKEPVFLEALRNLPVERDNSDGQNIGVSP